MKNLKTKQKVGVGLIVVTIVMTALNPGWTLVAAALGLPIFCLGLGICFLTLSKD